MQIKAKLQYFLEKIFQPPSFDTYSDWKYAKSKFNICFARVQKIEKGDLRKSGRTISEMKDGRREFD